MTNLRIAAAAESVGMSVSQIRYIERLGLLQPKYIGSHRLYGEKELDRLRTIKLLMEVGYRPNQLQAVLRASGVIQEERPLNGVQVLSRMLIEAAEQRAPFQVDVPDERAYNTTYKALGRLGRELGLRVHRKKEGASLTVLARPS